MEEPAATTPSPAPPQQQQQPQQQQSELFTSPTRNSQPTQSVRILGRNVNGTVVQTSMPQNEAELQLYRVMQRASLLGYYDTLLEMGGDDVQQLCDAGEEEFLEIMALVGMASKPLHVRRLQKALQEWLTNPVMFQTPVIAPPASNSKTPIVFPNVGNSFSPRPQHPSSTSITAQSAKAAAAAAAAAAAVATTTTTTTTTTIGTPPVNPPSSSSLSSQHLPTTHYPTTTASNSNNTLVCCPIVQRRKSPSPLPFNSTQGQMQTEQPLPSRSPGIVPAGNYESSSCGSQGTTPSPNGSSHHHHHHHHQLVAPPSPTALLGSQTTPVLLESQVQRLADAAERLAANLRPLNPKPPSGIKKKICKNLEMVMAMPDSDPRRMEEIRKYAAIYGRFDCKRKPEKPLTLHEVSVNEAAAQICRFVPALLTRRDELFPLARRVVRDSGHYYTKGSLHTSCSTSPRATRENGDGDLSGGDEESSKRRKLNDGDDSNLKEHESTVQHQVSSSSPTHNNSSKYSHCSQTDGVARLRCVDYARSSLMGIDSDSNSAQIQRHRKRQRRRRSRPMKLNSKGLSSPVWQSCSDNSNIVLDAIGDGLDDSNDCYSSFEDDWDDCNEDDCENNFVLESDEAGENDGDEDIENSTARMHDEQNRLNNADEDDACMTDKENDFNLKVIASCGDNIIAVANPALMNRNQPAATKEATIKEEIPLRDRRD